MNRAERRHDRDLQPVTSDGGDWKSRIYKRAEKRSREARKEEGRQSLRKRIGVPTPPTTLREKIMSTVKPTKQEPSFDVIAALRKRRAERERSEKVRHY